MSPGIKLRTKGVAPQTWGGGGYDTLGGRKLRGLRYAIQSAVNEAGRCFVVHKKVHSKLSADVCQGEKKSGTRPAEKNKTINTPRETLPNAPQPQN